MLEYSHLFIKKVMNKMYAFINGLKRYRKRLPKNVLKTIRGQAIAGDLDGAKKA